jgi:hypothetical protein
MSANDEKAAISVGEMARQIGMSRARFYQLVAKGVFPQPERHPETGRPYYTPELQAVCLEVRRSNRGIDGQPVLFYARRATPEPHQAPASRRQPHRHGDLIDALKALGLSSVTPGQVGEALKELFPEGRKGMEESQVIRSLFLHMRGRKSGSG